MPGGAIIAAGEHGCLFDKMPNCKNRAKTFRKNKVNSSRKIAKILAVDDPTVEIEIENSAVLRHLNGYADYFVLVDESCEGDEKPEGWQQCSLFKPGQQRVATFMQLRMNYAGVRLMEYARDRTQLVLNWLKIQTHVAEGLRLLHSANWVHGDLHHGNIVVDEDNVARIIDFGQSYNVNNIVTKSINLSFLPEYDNYAPELDYIAGIESGLSSLDAINQIYTKKKILYKLDEVFPSQSGVLGDLQTFAKFNEVTSETDIKKYIRAYARAGDIWTLGYNFFTIYMDMLVDQRFIESAFFKRNHGDQMKILRGMLHPDPRRRMPVDIVLKELYSMRMTWL